MGKVKYDSNPDNDYNDGYNAGRRYKPKSNWTKLLFLVALALAAIFLFLINTPKAEAWSYSVSGSAVCKSNGWEVSWVVNNEGEDEPLHILTSNREVVPAPVDVPAEDSSTFTETVVGNDPVTLTLTGDWDGDDGSQEQSATVEFRGECVPKVPEVVIPPEVVGLPNTSTSLIGE